MHMVSRAIFVEVVRQYGDTNKEVAEDEVTMVHFDVQGDICAIAVYASRGVGLPCRATYYARGCLFRAVADRELAKVGL